MKKLLARLKNSIEADLHHILDQKEQKNPIASLNMYVRQGELEIEKVRKFIERQHVLKAEFEREYHFAAEQAKKREQQAKIAREANEMDLYPFLIQEQNQYEERSTRLQELLSKVIQQLNELEQKYEEMKYKLKEMNIKRMELMGRENIARAHHNINRYTEGLGDTESPFSRFTEVEQYMERLEYQINTNYHRQTIDVRIAELEKQLKKQHQA